MSNEETESTSLLDFSKVDNEDDQDNNSKQEVKEKKEKENELSFYKPSIPLRFLNNKKNKDLFIAYSNEHRAHNIETKLDEIKIISNESARTKLKLKEILEEEVHTVNELPVDEIFENNDRPFIYINRN
jgi:hypothetical protein